MLLANFLPAPLLVPKLSAPKLLKFWKIDRKHDCASLSSANLLPMYRGALDVVTERIGEEHWIRIAKVVQAVAC